MIGPLALSLGARLTVFALEVAMDHSHAVEVEHALRDIQGPFDANRPR
jgi:hypothetical protein